MDAKQKAIELAYGEYWDKVKDFVIEDGFAPYRLLEDSVGITFEFKQFHIVFGRHETYVRPSLLRGIENNNGWIPISDIPKDFIKNNNEVYLSLNKIIFIGYFYKSISGINYNVCNLEAQPNEIIGHHIGNIYLLDGWQPIIKPKPPIY